MAKLVIVESPAKAKTIGKYLGDDYEVTASMGHIRDLPASQLGIDVEHGYAPQYISIKGKEKLIKELKSKAKHADGVLLATDPDREGEAISWHLANILGLDPHEPNRVTFDEITKKGVKEGMAHPRAIDEDLFNAQQARRVLDRLVGYKLSPFLWRKVRRGLSAGRVQSVAVRLIDDREKEIESFKPDEYWNVDATLGAGHKSFTARLATDASGKKLLPKSEAEARAIEKGLEGAEYVVAELKKGKRAKQPTPAFITSTLQQEASRRLGFTATRTMRAAQTLYEGVDIAGEGKKVFREEILKCKTILWNGPVGVFEIDKFATGSRAVAEAIAEATSKGAYSLIGGGDSVACINKFGLADKVSYVSTGGGALLEYMEGKELPGVAAIRK